MSLCFIGANISLRVTSLSLDSWMCRFVYLCPLYKTCWFWHCSWRKHPKTFSFSDCRLETHLTTLADTVLINSPCLKYKLNSIDYSYFMTETLPPDSSTDGWKDNKPRIVLYSVHNPVSECSLQFEPSSAFSMLCGHLLNTALPFDTKGKYHANKNKLFFDEIYHN